MVDISEKLGNIMFVVLKCGCLHKCQYIITVLLSLLMRQNCYRYCLLSQWTALY